VPEPAVAAVRVWGSYARVATEKAEKSSTTAEKMALRPGPPPAGEKPTQMVAAFPWTRGGSPLWQRGVEPARLATASSTSRFVGAAGGDEIAGGGGTVGSSSGASGSEAGGGEAGGGVDGAMGESRPGG
jgi:hypothetical protein